ncbi:MAG: hypothetical protein ABSH52_18440 [Terriglobia bacterium]|jgi:hypothetical protein
MNSDRKFFLLTYYQSPRDLNLDLTQGPRGAYHWQIGTRPMESQLHKIRDGLASGLLISVLGDMGYKYEGPILNLPETVADGLRTIQSVDVPIGSSDLLLLATRPPLNDFEEGEPVSKRYILRSHNALEEVIFEELQLHFLATCHRGRIILSETVELPAGCEDLREVVFEQSRGARVAKASVNCGEGDTVGYMLSTGSVRPHGPRLVAAFGIGGTETLWLSYLIKNSPQVGGTFHGLLKARERMMALAVFRVPPVVPSPFLHYELGAFGARTISCKVVE